MTHDQRPAASPGGPPADRYGRRAQGSATRRVLAAAIAAALLGGIALAWVGAGVLRVPVRTQEVGFAVVDDGAIEVTFLVTKEPGSTAQCRVRALSPSFAEVGVADVVVGPSSAGTVQVTAQVATSERATTGVVQACELLAPR